MFDGVHLGHQLLLNTLKEKAEKLKAKPLIITFDNHPKQVLDPNYDIKLLQTKEERLEKLSSLGFDRIVLIHFDKSFSKLSAEDFITILQQKYNPKLILLGYDNQIGNRDSSLDSEYIMDKRKDLIIERMSLCVKVDDIDVSSTKIRNALLKGDIPLANKLLGEDYSFSSTIISGDKIGRELGVPTANLEVFPEKLLPLSGVYFSELLVEGKEKYNSVTSIGIRPTLEKTEKRIEVHILDKNIDLYGKKVKLRLKDFLREEKKFDNLELLKQAINKDVLIAKEYFSKNE
jgi:riboflavin kinase/FMN adenylyltransferase